MSQAQNNVLKLYKSVIEDVINGVRDSFLDEGVDEQVLQELKQLWESKLMASKAIESNPEHRETVQTNNTQQPAQQTSVAGHASQTQLVNSLPQPPATMQQQTIPQQTNAAAAIAISDPHRLIPVQITVPPQSGSRSGKALTVQVPALVLQGNQLQTLLSNPAMAATFSLPTEMAQATLQHQIFMSLQERGIHIVSPTVQYQTLAASAAKAPVIIAPPKNTVPVVNPGTVAQLDGPVDTSDEDDDEDDEDNDDEEDNDDNDDDDEIDHDEDNENGNQDEEPLGPDDDVSDDNATDLFDTENVVVCQYDKITRSRNKWKMHLKDGIMNLNGKDYVFQRANGDAEW